MNRRKFLKGLAASVGLGTVAAPVKANAVEVNIPTYVDPETFRIPVHASKISVQDIIRSHVKNSWDAALEKHLRKHAIGYESTPKNNSGIS